MLHRRRNRPMFFIDIAVPRDVDPRMNEVEGCFVYDIDDLQQVAPPISPTAAARPPPSPSSPKRSTSTSSASSPATPSPPSSPSSRRRSHPQSRARPLPALANLTPAAGSRRSSHPLAHRQAPPPPAHRPPRSARTENDPNSFAAPHLQHSASLLRTQRSHRLNIRRPPRRNKSSDSR